MDAIIFKQTFPFFENQFKYLFHHKQIVYFGLIAVHSISLFEFFFSFR